MKNEKISSDPRNNKKMGTNEALNEKAPASLEADGAPQNSNQTDVQQENDDMNNNTEKNTNQTESNKSNSEEKNQNASKDSLDLSRLRLTQDFGAMAGVKKKILTIPVRKPNRQDFFRVHPDDEYSYSTCVLELKEDNEIFIVDPSLWSELVGEIVPKILFLTMNRQGVLTIWPIKLPDSDGRIDNWNHSAMEAALISRKQWIRLAANRSLGAYEVFTATGDLPEPDWPELTLQEIMDIAFRNKVIKDMDHPAIRRLRGES